MTLFRLIRFFISLVFAFGALCLFAYAFISLTGTFDTYGSAQAVPEKKVALVLGTNPYLLNGEPNELFEDRLDAAFDVFNAGKVEYLLLSGSENGGYNEPLVMAQRLGDRGIPTDRLLEDSLGKRTYDSVLRAKYVYGLDEFVVVSQKFHNERAIFIGHDHDIEIIGLNAASPSVIFNPQLLLRELVARARSLFDVYVFKPKVSDDTLGVIIP